MEATTVWRVTDAWPKWTTGCSDSIISAIASHDANIQRRRPSNVIHRLFTAPASGYVHPLPVNSWSLQLHSGSSATDVAGCILVAIPLNVNTRTHGANPTNSTHRRCFQLWDILFYFISGRNSSQTTGYLFIPAPVSSVGIILISSMNCTS